VLNQAASPVREVSDNGELGPHDQAEEAPDRRDRGRAVGEPALQQEQRRPDEPEPLLPHRLPQPPRLRVGARLGDGRGGLAERAPGGVALGAHPLGPHRVLVAEQRRRLQA